MVVTGAVEAKFTTLEGEHRSQAAEHATDATRNALPVSAPPKENYIQTVPAFGKNW